MKLSPNMIKTLQNLQRGKTTAYGYTMDTLGPTYLNGHSVRALIARGLLEQCGEMPRGIYMDGEMIGGCCSVYRISEAGRQALKKESCYLCGKEAESQCPDCGKWTCWEDRRDFPPDFDDHLCPDCVEKHNQRV